MRPSALACCAWLSVLGLPATVSAAEPANARWVYSERVDPITDAKRGFATLQGTGGMLVVKCDANGPGTVYMSIIPAGAYVGPSPGGRSVKVRVDAGEVRDDVWEYGRSQVVKVSRGTAEKYPSLNSGAPIGDLAVAFAPASKIVLRVLDYQFGGVDVVLASDGNADPIRRVFKTCGDTWPAAN